MRHNKIQQGFFSDLWLTAGVFSPHYLLERLPKAGSTVWPSDEKGISCTLKKVRNPDSLLHV
jgi:hypothetical protein